MRRGTGIAVFLHGTRLHRWQPIRTTSAALVHVPSGVLALMIGVTGGFFRAALAGTADLISNRDPCLGYRAMCTRDAVFRVTVVVSG